MGCSCFPNDSSTGGPSGLFVFFCVKVGFAPEYASSYLYTYVEVCGLLVIIKLSLWLRDPRIRDLDEVKRL